MLFAFSANSHRNSGECSFFGATPTSGGQVYFGLVKMCLRSVSDRNQLILANCCCSVGGGAVE